MGLKRLLPCRGFTLLEVIVTILLLGVLGAVLYGVGGFMDTELAARSGLLRNQIRYAQLRAMKGGAVYGLACNSVNYWFFFNSHIASSNWMILPGESDHFVHLADTGVTLAAFTLYFDAAGRPYTSYTDAGTNAPVSDTNPLNIVMTKGAAGVTLTVTPETGFVP